MALHINVQRQVLHGWIESEQDLETLAASMGVNVIEGYDGTKYVLLPFANCDDGTRVRAAATVGSWVTVHFLGPNRGPTPEGDATLDRNARGSDEGVGAPTIT